IHGRGRGERRGKQEKGARKLVPSIFALPSALSASSAVNSPWTLTARWIFPVDAPPLERGVITISGERILAVETCADRQADHDLGDVAILPGLVNAHTHLDLGSLHTLPTTNFTDWLKAVTEQRRRLRSDQVLHHIRAGLKQCSAYGTTLLGDISSQGLSWA